MSDYAPADAGWKRDGGMRFSVSNGTLRDTPWGDVEILATVGCGLTAVLKDGRQYHLSVQDAFALLVPVIEAEDRE